MVNNIRSIEVKNEDLVLILNKMVSMKKENGYMDFVEKGGVYTLNFYDENPKLNGFDAVAINQNDLIKYLLK